MVQAIWDEYFEYLNNKTYPCVGAKAALARHHIKCMVAHDMTSAIEDNSILKFLYEFVDEYRTADELYHSAVIIFQQPLLINEELFDRLMWERLQSLHDLDAVNYSYDKRVDSDPASSKFSFSLKEESFFIIGMHSGNSRESRKFKYPALAFNPHDQFERLRALDRYEHLKDLIRKRDVEYSGSVNPMLRDFGTSSEVYQYSGRQYPNNWHCPLIIKYGKDEHHSTS
jgi:FPC/CPF motif-containing protein YcgG